MKARRNAGVVTIADIPRALLLGQLEPAQEAREYQRILNRTGCSQRELARLVPGSQSRISLYLKHGGYWPPPLPQRTAETDPSWATPPNRHQDLKLWCAHLAEELGWLVALEHHLRLPGPRGTVDLVLSHPDRWLPVYAIEVKAAIATRRQLEIALEQAERYARALRCQALIVASHISADAPCLPIIAHADDLWHRLQRPASNRVT